MLLWMADINDLDLFVDKADEQPKATNAWEDEDDKFVAPVVRQYDELWERKKKIDEDIDENDKELLAASSEREAKNAQEHMVQLRKLTAANSQRKTKGIITATQFHPTDNILLTAGEDRFMHLFRIEGDKSVPLVDKKLKRSIQYAKYVKNEVMMTSQTQSLTFYDIESDRMNEIKQLGKYSHIGFSHFSVGPKYISLTNTKELSSIIIDSTSHLVVNELKGSRQILDSVFHPTEDVLITACNKGTINVWDLKKMRCRSLINDEGSLNCTSVTISPDGKYIAVGSDGGIVNVYDWATFEQSRTPKPFHSFQNLVTDCTRLAFRRGLLLMASNKSENQVRLANIEEKSVYSNVPGFMKLGRIQEVDISPSCGYFALGDSRGRVGLFRLEDYPNY